MVASPIKPQRLSAQEDEPQQGDWGPLQIATPAIVGGVLLLILLAYIIWQRCTSRKRSYDYHPVRSDWVNKMERMFVPRRTRMRVLHTSATVTIDDSMRTESVFDFRRTRQYRTGSIDSRAPLTSTDDTFDYSPNKPPFDYPPIKRLSDSPPPMPKRRTVRWWWLLGSRPQEIKSAEPGSRWRVDGPDGSSSGHDHSSHGHGGYSARYTTLEAVHEDREELEGSVIPIGDNFTSLASTPMTQHFPEQARAVRGLPTVLEHSSGARAPALVGNANQSRPGTPASANRGLPPSYDVSQRQPRDASADNIVRPPRSDPSYMVIPAPVPTASPRMYHGRDLSTDSFLATQSPMVTTTLY